MWLSPNQNAHKAHNLPVNGIASHRWDADLMKEAAIRARENSHQCKSFAQNFKQTHFALGNSTDSKPFTNPGTPESNSKATLRWNFNKEFNDVASKQKEA